jgi:hypothetical protein
MTSVQQRAGTYWIVVEDPTVFPREIDLARGWWHSTAHLIMQHTR